MVDQYRMVVMNFAVRKNKFFKREISIDNRTVFVSKLDFELRGFRVGGEGDRSLLNGGEGVRRYKQTYQL